jgi:serine/threonine protein kinase
MRHIIHRDLKPDNILIGLDSHKQTIHIIDFGLAKLYRDPQTHIHIPHRDSFPMIGTTRFASINAHLGIELSRRDDIESLAYILIYFMHGSLPWQGKRRESSVQKMKQRMPVDVICKGLPEEFEHLLKYARALKFSERPDYGYLRELFSNLRQDAGEGLERLASCFSDNFINLNSDSGTQEDDLGMGTRK